MIEFHSICKAFASVPVLKDVSFALAPGRTLGLVGENGAGKSTLMNILGGNLRPDSGEMRLSGQPYEPRSPVDATACGIAFIHQELNLFPNLSVAENLWLTSFPRRAGVFINRAALEQRTCEVLARVGLEISPAAPVERLSAGERQLLEIAKGLGTEARLFLFDEPTTSLTRRESEVLFKMLADLRRRGIAVIYITHNLEDVLRLCDDVGILRDGQLVGMGPAGEFDTNRLISLMVGRSLSQLFPPRTSAPAIEPLLEVRNLSQPGIIHQVSFTLRAGEILGLAGLMGSGRSELARILFGVDPCRAGTIALRGHAVRRPSPRSSKGAGVAFLTENRRDEGLCLDAAIGDNMAMAALPSFTRTPARLVSFGALKCKLLAMREAVRLTPSARLEQPAKTLSGGNQQKVVLAKWLLANPSVLILDEPTRGIDVGAKYEIYQLIIDLSVAGSGVFVISSELEELIGICDRILVMHRGEIRAEFPRVQFDREAIMRAAFGGLPGDG